MATFNIRYGEARDLPRLSEIERDAAQRFNSLDGYQFCATGAVRDRQEFQRGLEEGAILVGMSEHDELAGFALLWSVDGEAHLTELDVEGQFQGHGLGRLLVAAAESWARARNYPAMTLTTFRDVPWNLPFYQRLGYGVFSPGPNRKGMALIAEDERVHGFWVKPRVMMRKVL